MYIPCLFCWASDHDIDKGIRHEREQLFRNDLKAHYNRFCIFIAVKDARERPSRSSNPLSSTLPVVS